MPSTNHNSGLEPANPYQLRTQDSMNAAKSQTLQEVMEQLRSWEDPEPRTHDADCWKNHWRCLMQFAAAWLEELCEPEQAMPTEASASECEHIDRTGYCWCESGLLRCPKCQEWLGLGHVKKAIIHTPECDHVIRHWSKEGDSLVGVCCNYCPKCGQKL